MVVSSQDHETLYVLVTGANGGVGLALCQRLIDSFLQSRPQSHGLHIIVTTRGQTKNDYAISQLQKHLQKILTRAERGRPGVGKLLGSRIRFQPEVLDLADMISVRDCARRLLASLPKLDVFVCNAGIGGWTGVEWGPALLNSVIHPIESLTRPTTQIGSVGWTTKPHARPNDDSPEPPPLGEVFSANVFGHYLLAHYLMPLLARAQNSRIIWTSSIDNPSDVYDAGDFQCLKRPVAYESSRRITDVLALTYDLHATQPWVNEFLTPSSSSLSADPPGDNKTAADVASARGPQLAARPNMYLYHPGVCSTNLFPLPFFMVWLKLMLFYVARIVYGSIWHTCTPYLGACAAVWLALAPQETLDYYESDEQLRNSKLRSTVVGLGKGKWGSAVDRLGLERADRTEVDGWGFGGIPGDDLMVGKVTSMGRKPGSKGVTQEDIEGFQELGREVWKEMERLREDWCEWLGDIDDGVQVELEEGIAKSN